MSDTYVIVAHLPSKPTSPIQIPKTRYSQQLKADIAQVVLRFEKNKNKNVFCNDITQLLNRAQTIQLTPQQIVDEHIDTFNWICSLIPTLGGFLPTTSGLTIYNCGRPESTPLTPEQLSRITALTEELTIYHESTHHHPVLSLARPRVKWNPAIKQQHDPVVPDIFEKILTNCCEFVEDEHLTDDYSMRESILFLLGAKKLNSEDASYPISGNPKCPSEWITSLATAIVRKETSYNSIIECIGKDDWDTQVQSFLTHHWDLPKETNLMVQIQCLHPTINPELSLTFLREKSQLDIPSMSYDPYQLSLLAGLEICIKSELTRFILGFTAGAKGRLKNQDGYNAQCGSEYSNQGLAAIRLHEKDASAPKTIEEWIQRQIFHLRSEVLREHYLSNPDSPRIETFFFDRIMEAVESVTNPNTDLSHISINYHSGSDIQNTLTSQLTLEKCIERLQILISKQMSELAELDPTDDGKKRLIRLTSSPNALYQSLLQLKIIRSRNALSNNQETQIQQVKKLSHSIFILPPTVYLELPSAIQNPRHVMHDETMTLLRARLLHSLSSQPNLNNASRELLNKALDEKVIEKGIAHCLKHESELHRKQAISILLSFVLTSDHKSTILNDDSLIQTLLDCYPHLEAVSKQHIETLFVCFSEEPHLRVPLTETLGFMEFLYQHIHTHTWQNCAKNLIQDPLTHTRFSEFPDLIRALLPTLDPVITQSLISHHEFQPHLNHIFMNPLDWLFPHLNQDTPNLPHYCTMLKLLSDNSDTHFQVISQTEAYLTTRQNTNPLPPAVITILLSLSHSSSYLKTLAQFAFIQTHPNLMESTVRMLNQPETPAMLGDALDLLYMISKHPKSTLSIFEQLPVLVNLFKTHPHFQRAISLIFFRLSLRVSQADHEKALTSIANLEGLGIFQLTQLHNRFAKDRNQFIHFINTVNENMDNITTTLIALSRLNLSTPLNRQPVAITDISVLDSRQLELIFQRTLQALITQDQETQLKLTKDINAIFKESSTKSLISYHDETDSNFGLYIQTETYTPTEIYSTQGHVALNWEIDKKNKWTKVALFHLLNAFSSTQSIISTDLLSACLTVFQNHRPYEEIFESALDTFTNCIKQLSPNQENCIFLLLNSCDQLINLFIQKRCGQKLNDILAQLTQIPRFAERASQSTPFIEALSQPLFYDERSNRETCADLSRLLRNILTYENGNMPMDIRLRLLNTCLFNFSDLTQDFPKQELLELLLSISDRPNTFRHLHNHFSNLENGAHLRYILESLRDESTRDHAVVLLKRLTLPKTRLIHRYLEADPLLVSKLLPLLNTPEYVAYFSPIIAKAVKIHFGSRHALKLTRTINQLLRLNSEVALEQSTQTQYLRQLLKLALGRKSFGRWYRDHNVQYALNTPENQRFRTILLNTVAENSALSRLLIVPGTSRAIF